MRDEPERSRPDAPDAPEAAPREGAAPGGEERFPGGVESDEGQRPGEKTEDGQPGMAEDPPRTD